MTTHIMVDLETLDIASTAVILSIGATCVDFQNNRLTDDFYTTISIDSCKEVGLTAGQSTVDWWAQQSEQAREVFNNPKETITEALQSFSKYLKGFNAQPIQLWGNGADFDNTILANAYIVTGISVPWKFYNNRCFRTIKKMLGTGHKDIPRAGTYHNALDDAKHQATMLLQYKDYMDWGPGSMVAKGYKPV